MNSNIAISTKGIIKKYKDNIAVKGIDLEIKKGEIFSILGPNGAGKTTLVKMLSTLVDADAGSASIFGYDIKKDADKVRSLIGVTGQYATVDEELTAKENLMIFCRLNGLSKKESKERARELLEEFSLTEAADRTLKNFSGGMRRRLDLATSLISRPALIFLDEPTTGLDPRTRIQMWDTIRKLVASGSTILLTTQYLEEADQLANRVAIIDKGKLVAQGTPDELKLKIGDSQLELRLLNLTQMKKAKDIIEVVIKENVKINENENLITVAINDVKIVVNLLTTLSNEGIHVEEFSVKKPNLDEVFLKLTAN